MYIYIYIVVHCALQTCFTSTLLVQTLYIGGSGARESLTAKWFRYADLCETYAIRMLAYAIVHIGGSGGCESLTANS